MRLRLTTEAPVRVGGREQQVNKLEFVRHGGKLHAVSPRKLAGLLLQNSDRTLDDWSNEVLTRGQNADLTRFLRNKDLLNHETVEQISRYSVPCEYQNLNQFQPQARDAFGKLFIPGSAIKGAIRSAVIWALVDEDEANAYVGNNGGRSRFYARNLDLKVLQSYELPGARGSGPHFDLLRTVKVSDGYGKLESRVEKITIQSYTESRRGRTASLGASDTIYVECLTPGSSVEFDLKVDQKILRGFERENPNIPFANEESLLALVSDFYAEVWSSECRYYNGEQDEAPVPEEPPEQFPELEEWIEQTEGIPKGTLGKNKQKRYRAEYNTARRDFEAGRGGGERQKPKVSAGIEDSREMSVGKVRDFYKATCPGFRLGWGSGLFSTTVDMRLDEDNMGKVLNLISSRHHDARPIDGPKSRKLVGPEKTPRSPMGWAKLEVRN
jgi:CRISPR-associated protein Csm5